MITSSYRRAFHNLMIVCQARIPNEPNPIIEHCLSPGGRGLSACSTTM
jgi:hypothetical protein